MLASLRIVEPPYAAQALCQISDEGKCVNIMLEQTISDLLSEEASLSCSWLMEAGRSFRLR